MDKKLRMSFEFRSLCDSASFCNLCPRMCNRKKVLSSLNGSLSSKVVFIAEAPGRLGADRTLVPLHGDRTGDNFETLLSNIGWKREQVFITNAILCNPRDEDGNNATPTKDEIRNCSAYLAMTLNLINPDIIVTLGVKALEAIKMIQPHDYVLKSDVAKCLDWNGRKLFPLYHMSPRALIHRNLTAQRGDFIALSHLVHPESGLKPRKNWAETEKFDPVRDSRLISCLQYLLSKVKTASMFKLTKLLYLIDYKSLDFFGRTLTGSTYLRMQEGPWIPNLKYVAKELEDKDALHVTFNRKKPYYTLSRTLEDYASILDSQEKHFIDDIIEKYSALGDGKIKTLVYITNPMKYILKQEKKGRSMQRIPVIYQNKTVEELDGSSNQF